MNKVDEYVESIKQKSNLQTQEDEHHANSLPKTGHFKYGDQPNKVINSKIINN